MATTRSQAALASSQNKQRTRPCPASEGRQQPDVARLHDDTEHSSRARRWRPPLRSSVAQAMPSAKTASLPKQHHQSQRAPATTCWANMTGQQCPSRPPATQAMPLATVERWPGWHRLRPEGSCDRPGCTRAQRWRPPAEPAAAEPVPLATTPSQPPKAYAMLHCPRPVLPSSPGQQHLTAKQPSHAGRQNCHQVQRPPADPHRPWAHVRLHDGAAPSCSAGVLSRDQRRRGWGARLGGRWVVAELRRVQPIPARCHSKNPM